MLEIYTDAMREIMSKRIDRYSDMSGHTIKQTIKKTNSDGGVWLIIIFTDGYWIMIEPVRYDDNDVTFHIVDDDHFHSYEMYLMKEVGICSEEIYKTEHDLYMAAYYKNIDDTARKRIIADLPKYPDIYDKVREIINHSGI